MITEAIKNFPKQFKFKPIIENRNNLRDFQKIIVVGMGGSHLAADLLKWRDPVVDLVIHRDYGLPALSEEELRKSLVICSSYSGNTEEAIDAFNEAFSKRLNLAVVATGGELLELANKNDVPFVELPQENIQPRMALGFSLLGLLRIIGKEDLLGEAMKLTEFLNWEEGEEKGKNLAEALEGKVPVIYSSSYNKPIVYNWKIKFNETAKIPAFFNVFPELNHNEMTGFDVVSATSNLSKNFHFIFIKDERDDKRIVKRMEICKNLYQKFGFGVEEVELKGEFLWQKLFGNLMLADWTAYYLAKNYNVEPEKVLMVEEFKRMMKE